MVTCYFKTTMNVWREPAHWLSLPNNNWISVFRRSFHFTINFISFVTQKKCGIFVIWWNSIEIVWHLSWFFVLLACFASVDWLIKDNHRTNRWNAFELLCRLHVKFSGVSSLRCKLHDWSHELRTMALVYVNVGVEYVFVCHCKIATYRIFGVGILAMHI